MAGSAPAGRVIARGFIDHHSIEDSSIVAESQSSAGGATPNS
jgi:N-acyl-D-aspartate/D-glutamate deacylase